MLETAFAKINLALHVRRRRDDGYHDIETIFAFAEHGDVVEVVEGPPGLTITGPFAGALGGTDAEDNLVMRAIRGLASLPGTGQAPAIRLDKRLPVAAGIGGGSADAAAAIRLLSRLWGIGPNDPRVDSIAAGLGADVPACLLSMTTRGDGRGDELRPVEAAGLAGMPLLLVNPGIPLATGPVFSGWDERDRGGLDAGDPLAAALVGRNDLEAPARALSPVIGEVLACLAEQPGTILARMSGSGATCFALFGSDRDRAAAARRIAAVRPTWWRLESRIR